MDNIRELIRDIMMDKLQGIMIEQIDYRKKEQVMECLQDVYDNVNVIHTMRIDLARSR